MQLIDHFRRPDDQAFIAAMLERRATTPDRALPTRDLPPIPRERLERFVAVGLLREGPPGSFYLYEKAALASELVMEAVPWTGPRLWKTLIFWLIALALPLVLIYLAG